MPKESDKPAKAAPTKTACIDGDIVDRIGEYLWEEFPQLDRGRLEQALAAVRAEFRGEMVYIPSRSQTERQQMAHRVLSMFNGRNTREIARRLGIGHMTVYRYIKQAGKEGAEVGNSTKFYELDTSVPVRSRRTSAAAPGVPVVASAPAGTAGEPTASAPWPSLKQTSTL
ncbi:Mor transcription activator family protein [Methylibium sp.]|uniref:Mor transcription activator family protein n=1 Tax=Methylibium sp. TaxID=2067992 RepID=UPI003BAA493C